MADLQDSPVSMRDMGKLFNIFEVYYNFFIVKMTYVGQSEAISWLIFRIIKWFVSILTKTTEKQKNNVVNVKYKCVTDWIIKFTN